LGKKLLRLLIEINPLLFLTQLFALIAELLTFISISTMAIKNLNLNARFVTQLLLMIRFTKILSFFVPTVIVLYPDGRKERILSYINVFIMIVIVT